MTHIALNRVAALIIATVLLVGALVAASAATSSAQAAGCRVNGYLTGQSPTYGYTAVTAQVVTGYPCDYIQARMDRYYAGSQRSYFSAWGRYGTAYVSTGGTTGVFAGGFGRGKDNGVILPWTRINHERVY